MDGAKEMKPPIFIKGPSVSYITAYSEGNTSLTFSLIRVFLIIGLTDRKSPGELKRVTNITYLTNTSICTSKSQLENVL